MVVGLLLAFVGLLTTLRLEPYAHRSLNAVGAATQLNLFLLLLVALLLKVNLDGAGDARFFSGILGTLIILPLVLPLATRFYLRFQGGGLEGRSLMRDAEWSD